MSIKLPILYVDDEESILLLFKRIFGEQEEVVTFKNAKEALEFLKFNKVKTILSDEKMPEMTGHEFLAECAKNYPLVPRILVTGFADYGALVEAVNSGKIFHFISKPWANENLKIILKNANDKFESEVRILNQVESLQKQLQELSKLEQAKDLFLQLISHELKTPITSLLGLWELLEIEPSEFSNLHESIRSSIDRLVEITKSILLLISLETGIAVQDETRRFFDHWVLSLPQGLPLHFFEHFQKKYLNSVTPVNERELSLEFKVPLNQKAFEFIGQVYHHHKDLGIDGIILQALIKRCGLELETSSKGLIWNIKKST